jgi:peptidoglycan/LPS O-acetylase OafA/YrhL
MKNNYRPDIDGLRAISVFAIIIYHANFIFFDHHLLKGGFVGVDIFFVISGYLIGNIILKELVTKNKFSFKNFYERRARRILPVLLFAITISLIVGYFFLLPESYKNFSRSAITSVFFLSNFYFWATNSIYGSEDVLLKPLAHTWSLSIEEQFYIFFPILILIIFRFFKKYFFQIIFCLFLSSLIFANWSSKTYLDFTYTVYGRDINFHNMNFYLLPSRIFELLAGSILSYVKLNKKYNVKYNLVTNEIFTFIGIILIFFSFIFFEYGSIFHPSFVTLIPVTGTMLIIYFSNNKGLITKILSNKIFVFFGLISYSLYIWHYPIFSYLRYLDVFNYSFLIKVFSILTTIILSIFSYYKIEKPFRDRRIVPLRYFIVFLSFFIFFIIFFSFYIIKKNGIKNRFPSIVSETLKSKEKNQYRIIKELKNVILIGDSHSRSIEHYLNKELKFQNYNLVKLDESFYVENFNSVDKKTNTINKNFIETNYKISNFLKENKNQIVVYAQRWTVRFSDTNFDNEEGYKDYQTEAQKSFSYFFEPSNIKTSSLEERQKYLSEGIKLTLNNILKNGHTLIIVYPIPEMGFDVPKLMNKKIISNYIIHKNYDIPFLSVSYDVYKKRNKMIINILDSIENSNIYRIYPDKSFCNTELKNRCIANNKKHLFYYDTNHLSLEGSKYIVSDIIKALKQIEFKNIF